MSVANEDALTQAMREALSIVTEDDYARAKRLFEQAWLRALLDRHGRMRAAARAAGMTRQGLYQLAKRAGFTVSALRRGDTKDPR